MDDAILCIDDDPAVLAGFQRTLRRLGRIDVAPTGGDALQMASTFGPYAAVIADMHMPGIDGITVLARLRETAPDTVRLMLTGADDQRIARDAVNQGQIFRFLQKPCPPDELVMAVHAAIRHYHLLAAEHDLLQRTLAGAIHVLTEIMGLVDPHAVGRLHGQRDRMRHLCRHIGVHATWEVEVAAMLADLGGVTIPPSVAARALGNEALSEAEREMLANIPETGAALLASIPRLTGVAEIVRYQAKHWDGGGTPADACSGQAIPAGARILHLIRAFDRLLAEGLAEVDALAVLRGRVGFYEPALIDALATTLPAGAPRRRLVHRVTLADLQPGMLLRAPIDSVAGQRVTAAGQMVTPTLIERLRNFARIAPLNEPFTVESAG
jgi:response regulator RpfG family c-di-GMP phosphodiesterase